MKPEATNFGRQWDEFWRGGSDAAIVGDRGATSPALKGFWSEAFSGLVAMGGEECSLLDLASGAGVVSETALAHISAREVTAVDISAAAVNATRSRLGVKGIVANCADLPFSDGAFSCVASQYGLEYAGQDAFGEAARALAPGGAFVALVHVRGGAIEAECSRDADVAGAVIESNVLSAVADAFQIASGRTGAHAPQAAMAANREALMKGAQALKTVRATYGDTAASGLAVRINDDIARLFQRMSAYEPQEVLDWSAGVEAETRSYLARMTSMQNAALDEPAVQDAAERMRAHDVVFETTVPQRLYDGAEPIAWIFKGAKPS